MNLRETFKQLSKEEQDSLFAAFNEENQLIIRIQKNFIGVHVSPTPGLKIIEVAGYWCIGEFDAE